LTDSQDYDLIVDDGKPKRIQVKTTSYKRYGSYVVGLKVKGGNRSYSTAKLFDPFSVEAVYVLTEEGTEYLVPSASIGSRQSLVLGAKYDKYKLMGM
jgi:hypothetical protein